MTTELDLVFRAPRMITPAGEAGRCVGIRDGVIVAIEPLDADLRSAQSVQLGPDEVLLPGLVDTHVHVNEPGRTEWEGFASATRAAAAGGVTTILDMPLNSIPPTTDVAALEAKKEAAAGNCHIDVGFWGGAVPGNRGQLALTPPGCSASSASCWTPAWRSSSHSGRPSSRATSPNCGRSTHS